MCVSTGACVRVRVRLCARVRVRLCARVSVRVSERVTMCVDHRYREDELRFLCVQRVTHSLYLSPSLSILHRPQGTLGLSPDGSTGPPEPRLTANLSTAAAHFWDLLQTTCHFRPQSNGQLTLFC